MTLNKYAILAIVFSVYFPMTVQAADKINLSNTEGKNIGSIDVSAAAQGLLIHLEADNLSPGWHGFHAHAVGDCSDHTDHFKKSGGHYTKEGQTHGYVGTINPHAGDFPNIWVADDGKVKAEFYAPNLTLEDLKDADGSAFMIHANPDDYKSQPSGDAGDRLACGVANK